MSESPFQRAELEYYGLRGKLAVGRISREQFDQAVGQLAVQDAQGRYWKVGIESGKWHVYNGTTWVPADPSSPDPPPLPSVPASLPEAGVTPRPPNRIVPPMPPSQLPPPATQDIPPVAQYGYAPPPPPTNVYVYPQGAPAPAAKSGMGCGRCSLLSCLAIVLLLCVLGVGGIVAYQSGALTLNQVLNLVGMGPATIEVDNFRDDAIIVNIAAISADKGTTSFPDQLELNAFDVKTYRSQNPEKFRVDFMTKAGTSLGTCNLNLKGGDHYQFVALPQQIAVNRANNPSNVGSDFVIQTSNLCR